MDELKTLAEVCNITKVSRRAVQGYEEKGLVGAKEKNKYGHLLYDDEMIRRIERIKLYQQLGFKVREIQEIIDKPNDVLKSELMKKVILLEKDIKVKQWVILQVQKIIEELS